MIWFKHYSNSLDSDSLMALKRKYGFEGLGRYWALIEFLYSKWSDSKSEPYFEVQREKLRDLFGIRSWNGLEAFADHLATIPGLDIQYSENVYRIKAPILLKLLHSDFKKSGGSTVKIPPKNKKESKKESSSRDQLHQHPALTFDLQFDEKYKKFESEMVNLCGDTPTFRRQLPKIYETWISGPGYDALMDFIDARLARVEFKTKTNGEAQAWVKKAILEESGIK